MLVVSHNFYLLRSHIPSHRDCLYSPYSSGLSRDSSELCVFNRVLAVLGSEYWGFFVLSGFVNFFHCFGSYACTDTLEYFS